MESWQIDVLKIGITAVVTGVAGWWAHWKWTHQERLKAELRERERQAEYDEFKKKRRLTGAKQTEAIDLHQQVFGLLANMKDKGVDPDDYFRFHGTLLGGSKKPGLTQAAIDSANADGGNEDSRQPIPIPSGQVLPTVEQWIIAALMIGDGTATFADITALQPELREPELREAANRLVGLNFVATILSEQIKFVPGLDHYPMRVAELFRYFINGAVVVKAIGCGWYKCHVNDALLDEACRTQMNLGLLPEERREALLLMQWSPLALIYALTPDPMLTRHRNESPEQNDLVWRFDRLHFRRMLYHSFFTDFMKPGLGPYFNTVAGITEVFRVQTYKIKHQRERLLEGTVEDRNLILQGDASLGHNYLHILGLGEDDPPFNEAESANTPSEVPPA